MTDSIATDKPPEVILHPLGDIVTIPRSVPAGSVTPKGPTPYSVNGGSPPTVPMGYGRIKAPPVCLVPALRKECMSAEQLSEWCFQPEDLLNGDENDNGEGNEGTGASSVEDTNDTNDNASGTATATATATAVGATDNEDYPIQPSPLEWTNFKKSILQRTESRNGRETQRFATDPQTGNLMRLTTGSVPIMSDGRILLISSSRKEEWILPKGGWESDETVEVSALRETYEEGGILGTLGPKLTHIEYETRKAKKRRLELASLKKKYEIAYAAGSGLGKDIKDITVISNSANSSICQSEDDLNMQGSGHCRDYIGGINSNIISKLPSPIHKECIPSKIKHDLSARKISADRLDDVASQGSIASCASDGSTSCGHVRMCMSPLYVLEVREHWPESGRARKVVDIDTAIEMMKSRPEFHQVLIEVKEKGYHLKPHKRMRCEEDSVAGGASADVDSLR